MRAKQASMLQSLRSARDFLDDHADKLAGVVNSGARKKLDEAIAELEDHASTQSASLTDAMTSTRQKGKLRQALILHHMAPIARIAEADLPNNEETLPLRMPAPRLNTVKLAAAAEGMGKAAAKYADTFTATGLPADFVDRLNAAARAMVGALGNRTRNRGIRKGATSGLKTKIVHGRKIGRIVDAFVQSALADDKVLLANWNTVRRVELAPAGRSAADPAPAPSPTL